MDWVMENWDTLLAIAIPLLGLLVSLVSNKEKAAALQRLAMTLQAAKIRGGPVGQGAREIIDTLKSNAAGDSKGVIGEIDDAVKSVKRKKPQNKAKKAIKAIGKVFLGRFLGGL